MSYETQADLFADQDFAARLAACLTVESRGKVSDPLAAMCMRWPNTQGVAAFMPFVSSAPGFDAKYEAGGQAAITDGDLLSAVQACWNDVAIVQIPPVAS